MCFFYDGVCEIYERSNPKARKRHKCVECGGAIHQGEKYHRVESLFEGDWTTDIWCERCNVVREVIIAAEQKRGCDSMESQPPRGQLKQALWDDEDGYGLVAKDEDRENLIVLDERARHLIQVAA